MTRTCYLCQSEIITAGGKSACEGCGTSYPPVELPCMAPGNYQRAGVSSSVPSLAGLSTPDPRGSQVRADAPPRSPLMASDHPRMRLGRGTDLQEI